MYRFILGGPGSGKSERVFTDCIAAAKADDRSHFLLVTPEQSTTWAEKEIIRLHSSHATDNIDVVSFSRLAYRIFNELGIVNPPVINDIEKAMIIRRIGFAHKDELKIWGSRFDKPGFVDNLKSMISELYQYGVAPEDIVPREEFGSRLNNKLTDLRLIYSEFKKEIKDKYIPTEEIPDILAKNIHRSEIIKKSVIMLDGFTGFTPIQYRIIEEFLCYAKEVVVTVSIGEDRDNPLFQMGRDMILSIEDLGNKNSINRGKDMFLQSDNFIEKHILRFDGATYVPNAQPKCSGTGGNALQPEGGRVSSIAPHSECSGTGGNVLQIPRIVRARNMKEESEFICCAIERLVKKEGLRYRDIAVVCSDQEAYGSLLAHQMDVSGIPSYMDETIGMGDNALVMMITGALDVISSDYSYESFVRYLKSGLPEDDEDRVFILDNYIYECGRRGYRRMSEHWDYVPADLKKVGRAKINRYKDEALDKLEGLHTLFSSGKASVPDIVDAISRLMDRCGVIKKMEALKDGFKQEKDRYREREYEKAYESVTNILNDMKLLLMDEELTPEEFARIFSAGIDQVKLGVLPSGADRVTIGDITRSRIEGVKVLFVAGANEGMLPKLLNRKSVITDTEKERLKKADYDLAPTAREDLLNQRYYVYRIFSKPTRQLIVSFSGVDAGGSARKASYVVVNLLKLYPQIKVEDAFKNLEVLDINSAVNRIGERLREMRIHGVESTDAEFEKLYEYLREKDDIKTGLITDAALYSYQPEKLSEESIDLLYGDLISGSVSKLETFAECPFKYFARYGLELKEIEEFTFRAMDIGNIAHAALEHIFVKAGQERVDLRSLSEDEKSTLVSEAIDHAILDDESSKYKDSSHNEYIVKRVERVVKRSLWGLLEKLDDGFRPYRMEWSFDREDSLKVMRFDLGGKRVMELSGKVDRTDICDTDPSKIGVRIIDYKSGNKSWDLNDVINGNDLQITMYMAAVQELLEQSFKGRDISPEQMYYYTVKDPIVDKDELSAGRSVEDELMNEMTLAGVSEKENIELLLPYVRGKAEGLGKRIAGGDITVAPKLRDKNHTSCTFCNYRSLCGFDKKLEGYSLKADKKYKKEDQWQIIRGQMNS